MKNDNLLQIVRTILWIFGHSTANFHLIAFSVYHQMALRYLRKFECTLLLFFVSAYDGGLNEIGNRRDRKLSKRKVRLTGEIIIARDAITQTLKINQVTENTHILFPAPRHSDYTTATVCG